MDENVNKPLFVENNSFDCIVLGEETTQHPSSLRESKQSMLRRHLQEDKSSLYTVSSPQQTGFKDPDASTREITEINDNRDGALQVLPKQRRLGVTEGEASAEQRQRKIGIAENKKSVSERTFLRVLHKKF